ncbi:diguanylate cyclase [Nitrosococcus halophilus Nc 4]|uniref:diguanylate cyclase n=1 Tax=Nitrosococcus halophilus (strain Nc4) TaxID=472759 RepID=D5BZB8_NITHN|nr:diguanylate cyclase [Nitrosococcus halophilus]ADE16132.1 diguanylate cyclase [Nitrosococcus halophilus Nc 4]
MHTIPRAPGVVRLIVGLTSLAILGSVMLTALGFLLLKRAIEVEILLITAVVVALVVPLLILVFFRLIFAGNREHGGRRLAIKELWSQAFNCRYLLQQAEITLVQAKRGSTTFSLLLLEIDNLKEIKEIYGFSAAERVLQALAQAGLEIVRSSDVIARCSDEKFMMFLPETGTEEALIIAHRIRHVLSQVPVIIGNTLISFTVSIGVAAYDENTVTIDRLLRRVGQALYNAKQHGSNRVEVG